MNAHMICPHCQNLFKNVPVDWRGRKVRCKKCGGSFIAKPDEDPIEIPPAVCPGCLKKYSNICYYVRRLLGAPRVFAEYVDGGSLHDWIRKGTLYRGGSREALKRILDIAVQFAWGLDFSHEQGLIHQDVKPANVMLTADG